MWKPIDENLPRGRPLLFGRIVQPESYHAQSEKRYAKIYPKWFVVTQEVEIATLREIDDPKTFRMHDYGQGGYHQSPNQWTHWADITKISDEVVLL